MTEASESTDLEGFKDTHVYTYEVTMLIQIIAPTREVADIKLDKEGGYISKRSVDFKYSTPVYIDSLETTVEDSTDKKKEDDEEGWH